MNLELKELKGPGRAAPCKLLAGSLEMTMNRYRISAKFEIFDTTKNGDLEEIFISDPTFLVSPKPVGTNSRNCHIDVKPRGFVSSEIERDKKRKPVKVVLEIDAPDFEQAKHWGFDEIAVRADLLAAFTSGSVKIKGGMTCQEITPNKEKKVAEVQSESVMSEAVLEMEHVGRAMLGHMPNGLPPEPVLRSMRWFRNGLASILPEDIFFCFWISLEAVTNKKNKVLLMKHANISEKEFKELKRLRNILLHGNVQITEKLRNELVSKLEIMRSAIYRAYESLLGFEPGKFPFSNRPMFGQSALILTIGKKPDNELAK